MSLLSWLNRLSDDLAAVLDAKATDIREATAEHGMARWVEGYAEGYEAGRTERVRSTKPDLCGYLGACREPVGHDLPHRIRDGST